MPNVYADSGGTQLMQPKHSFTVLTWKIHVECTDSALWHKCFKTRDKASLLIEADRQMIHTKRHFDRPFETLELDGEKNNERRTK